MLHRDSMNHVNLARKLITTGDEVSLRYAALEIRIAIERLFYKLLPAYREELPDDLLKRWQPKQIIDALIDCDPDIERDFTLIMAEERPGGGHGPASIVGKYKAVNRKLLQQYYHKIGSYLHAPLDDKPRDPAKILSFLNAAATRIEEYCRKTTVISNIATFHTVQCVCGRTIKRNARAVQIKPYIRCPNNQCRAVFDLLENDENKAEWKLRETEFVCPQCETSTFFGHHLIDSGVSFTCVGCHQKYIVRTGLFASRVNASDAVE